MVKRIDRKRDGGFVFVVVIATVAFLTMATIVVTGVNREEPPTFVPTPLGPGATGAVSAADGSALFTVDATDPERWRFFSFGAGTVVENPGPLDWDLAFRRFQVIANGGPGFAGGGGALDLGEVPLDAAALPSAASFVANTVRSDTVNAVLDGWYGYSYFTHLLTPAPRVFAVRTADGRSAMLQFVGYYCPGAQPGCVTFRYRLPDGEEG